MPDTPFSITLATTLIGAAIIAFVFWRLNRSPLMGLLVGGLAGSIGPQIFMLPLGYCAFDGERDRTFTVYLFNREVIGDATLIVAYFLIISGTWVALLLGQRIYMLARARQPLLSSGAATPGMFGGWRLAPWLLLSPTLIVLTMFSYYPTFETFRLSTQLVRLGAPRTAPVCLDNFATLISGTRGQAVYHIFSDGHIFKSTASYMSSFGISFFMAFFIVIFALSFSLIIATMAQMPIKGARIYRTLLIWPYAISPVVAGIIFSMMFNPITGLINYSLETVGLPRVDWLRDPSIAPWAVIAASVWNIMGFNILFYIAGLQNVPDDLLEAASIDGANAFQRFMKITVPLLSPITFFLIITNMTYAFFDTFGLIDYLTAGGPVNSTTNLIYGIYEIGVQNRDLGKAAAQSIVLLMIVIGLTIVQFRTAGRRVNYGA